MSQTVHGLLNRCGIEVRLTRNLQAVKNHEREKAQLAPWQQLKQFNIQTIFDIGANTGQFASVARSLFPEGHIYAFEPLPGVYRELVKNKKGDQNITPVNLGLSDRSTQVQMFCSAFSPSSSLLPMGALHRSEWPESDRQSMVDVRVIRLDEWVQENEVAIKENCLVKIDVQGHELGVIKGGVETLRRSRLIVIEVSFYELYEQQPLFEDIHDALRDLGFIYRGNIEQHYSKKHHKILFADAIFENMKISA